MALVLVPAASASAIAPTRICFLIKTSSTSRIVVRFQRHEAALVARVCPQLSKINVSLQDVTPRIPRSFYEERDARSGARFHYADWVPLRIRSAAADRHPA